VNQAEFKEIAWLLMLIPFGIVAGTGIFFIYCAWRRACQRPE
jgi:ABC-type nickel/cobalt efflux system permease component RcnA